MPESSCRFSTVQSETRPLRICKLSESDIFVKFLQALLDRTTADVEQIAGLLGFGRASDFENWVPTIAPLAYDVERLAPDLANDGPNPEYPWPQKEPVEYPAGYEFSVWKDLKDTGRGRQLLKVLDAAVREFPKYA